MRVEQNRAGAAFTRRTTLLGSGQIQPVTQHFEQSMVRGHIERMLPAIDPHPHCSLLKAEASTRRLITCSIASRYSRLPRTSEMGEACSTTRIGVGGSAP